MSYLLDILFKTSQVLFLEFQNELQTVKAPLQICIDY